MLLALTITVAVLLVACVWLGLKARRVSVADWNMRSAHDRWKELCYERRIDKEALRESQKEVAERDRVIRNLQAERDTEDDEQFARMWART